MYNSLENVQRVLCLSIIEDCFILSHVINILVVIITFEHCSLDCD